MIDILLIEVHCELAKLLKVFLEKEGFSLIWKQDGESALQWLETHRVKVVLLDVMLPGMDGFAICNAIRQQADTPVIFLSARTAKEDKLSGYTIGADDYIEKPVDPELLCAKVRAMIQRTNMQPQTKTIQSGGLLMDISTHKVYVNEKQIELNVKEFSLLQLFLEHEGKTLHKEYLFNTIWGSASDSEYQTLTVHIKMLRTKIEENPKEPKRIQTIWGIGYRYEKI